MTSIVEVPDWQILAEEASKETDHKKLSVLVEQLCCALDREKEKLAALRSNSFNNQWVDIASGQTVQPLPKGQPNCAALTPAH